MDAVDPPVMPVMIDEQAFIACYRRTIAPLRAYAARVLGNATHADDIVQETYLRLLRMAAPPSEAAELRALLMRIAGNLIIDHWRKRRREGNEGQTPIVNKGQTPNIALRIDMQRVFQRLRPRDRQLLWLAHVEGANHQEIAQALGIRQWSVRVLLSRARRKLAKLLRETGHLAETRR